MCLAAVLTLPAGAGAKPGYFVLRPHTYSGFVVKGSRGYEIDVVGTGRKLEIEARRGLGVGSVTYRLPGHARHGRIKANLGILGRIDLRFEPKSVESNPHGLGDCRGKPAREEEGIFVGTVRFRGEDGYTRFSAARVRGYVSHNFRRVCDRPRCFPTPMRAALSQTQRRTIRPNPTSTGCSPPAAAATARYSSASRGSKPVNALARHASRPS